jgi:hypothetical protein
MRKWNELQQYLLDLQLQVLTTSYKHPTRTEYYFDRKNRNSEICNLNEHLGIDIIIEIASLTSTWLWEIQMKYQAKLTTSCLQVKHVMSVTLFRHYC